ncbi:MAG: hypothetical protein CL677_07835 [Bdellovibrionaceae bacterium]|nr:hypothetical protein [Pseudobdellovibrionaceae bacterium]
MKHVAIGTALYLLVSIFTVQIAHATQLPFVLWPGTAIVLGMALVYGYSLCWAAFLGTFLTGTFYLWNTSSVIGSVDAFIFSCIPAMYLALQTALGVFLVRRFIGERNHFKTESSTLKFFGICGFISPLPGFIAAYMSVSYLAPQENAAWIVGTKFYLTMVLANLTITPLVVHWLAKQVQIKSVKKRTITASMTLVLLVVVALSTLIEFRQSKIFNADYDTTRKNTEKTITTYFSKLNSSMNGLKNLFLSSQIVDDHEFLRFTKNITTNIEGLDAVAWIAIVDKHNRAKLEMRTGKSYNIGDHVISYIYPSLPAKMKFIGSIIGSSANVTFKNQENSQAIHSINQSLSRFTDGTGSVLTSYPIFDEGKKLDYEGTRRGFIIAESKITQMLINNFSDMDFPKVRIKIDVKDNNLNSWSHFSDLTLNDFADMANFTINESIINVDNISFKTLVYPSLFFQTNSAKGDYLFFHLCIVSAAFIFNCFILILTIKVRRMNMALNQLEWEIKLRRDSEEKVSKLNENLEKEILKQTKEIREKGLEFESIFRTFPDSVFKIDFDGRIKDYHINQNSPFSEISRDYRELKIQNVVSNINYSQSISSIIESFGESKEVKTFTAHYSKPNDEEVHLEVRIANTGAEQLIVFFRDTSKRVQMEHHIREQHASAAVSSKLVALGEMAGGIAHEINNPLAIIDGYAYNIRKLGERGSVDPKKMVYLSSKIESTVKRVAKIITGLRKFSRDGSNDEVESIRVVDFLADTLAFCQERFESHGIDLQINEIPDSLVFSCRTIELSQVFINILNNAFHAVYKREKRWIRIEIVSLEDYIEFNISDSGEGIPESVRSKIMDPFFTTKKSGVGTGLGLSISKGIIDSHQGEFFLKEDSEHTHFVIRIPWNIRSSKETSDPKAA